MAQKVSLVIAFIIALILLFVTTNAFLMPRDNQATQSQDIPFIGWIKDFLGGFGNTENLLKEPPVFPGFIRESDRLIVTYAPYDVHWSQIDKGDSICTLPTGKLSGGDIITDCSGIVTLVYKPAEQTLGTWKFSSYEKSNGNSNINNQEDKEQNNTQDADNTPILPVIKITKPGEKAIYFQNSYLSQSQITRIFGDIDVEVAIENPSNMSITGVKFYINDEFKYDDKETPYTWNWDEGAISRSCEIKVVAYNQGNSELSTDEILVMNTNLRII